MAAAIHTSVIGTKISCDFTRQLVGRREELSCAVSGGAGSGEGALELSLCSGGGGNAQL